MQLKKLAATTVRYGSLRLHTLLRREGWAIINAKRVNRLYREEQPGLRTKTPRRLVRCQTRALRPSATRIDDYRAMDFMTDELFDGHRIRLVTIVDHFTRESLSIEIEPRFRGQDVVLASERIAEYRRLPKTIQIDNGPEFISKALNQWAYANQVTLGFSRPGKPTDNAFIESFNGSVRAECLNENLFLSLEDAREKIESWQRDYNEHRPNSVLSNLAPREFASSAQMKILDFLT